MPAFTHPPSVPAILARDYVSPSDEHFLACFSSLVEHSEDDAMQDINLTRLQQGLYPRKARFCPETMIRRRIVVRRAASNARIPRALARTDRESRALEMDGMPEFPQTTRSELRAETMYRRPASRTLVKAKQSDEDETEVEGECENAGDCSSVLCGTASFEMAWVAVATCRVVHH
ncbi:uncharacterized protein ARMOST_12809 [Armillaria ostoyae]|uniref:Uncharacterized protein n=1 Tax=Armillaria ostoyae TaxID=47428 RepID=A0A284RL15_ARMOS|nr:uncharacterized protein ARMOST_12809 [Armillaria ostoyae]